jgi:glycosyltransferase involved in cell wall biosynthesis
MRITALVKNLDHVCCRYRLAAFQPFLERAGHRVQFVPLPSGWWGGFSLPRCLSPTDVIIVQRKLLSADQLKQVRARSRWLIFDYDDAVFLRDSYAARGPYSDRRLAGFARMIHTADIVTAGNRFLAEQATLWKASERVVTIRTCIDPQRYRVAEHRRTRGAVLTWIGSSATLCGLEQVRPMWDEIGRRLPGLSLRIICDRTLSLPNLPVCFCPWSERDEARLLAAADIGISWLPDDAWSRGKCGLKVLQYMAAGLPVVANPVGVQAQLVQDGRTGFLVNNTEQWVEAIDRLSRDPELRRRMGQAARRVVESDFDIRSGAAQWLDLLRQLDPEPAVPTRDQGTRSANLALACVSG